MSRIIQVQGEVSFPPVCAVCLSPAEKRYTVERTFSYGREGIAARVEVPLCASHYALAARKSKAEKTIGRLGFWLGGVLGLTAGLGLVIYWAGSGQGSLIPNILLALAIAVGIFLIVWSAALFWLAPRFADPESLRAREAVRILRFWPGDQLMELDIQDERIAEMIAQSQTVK